MTDIDDKKRGIGTDKRTVNRADALLKTVDAITPREPRANTFASSSAAAKDAIKRFNPRSIKENREYGGTIYRMRGSNRFTYVIPPNIQPLSFKGGHVSTAQEIPTGATEVGRWHTHGKTENYTDEDFSVDGGDVELVRPRRIPSWLGTPKGAIKEALPLRSGVLILDIEPAEGTRPNIRFIPN